MLSEKDIRDLNRIISKIKHPEKGLEQGVFDALCPIITHVACEMVIINSKKQVLLTWREDSFWKGWHFPGGLLRYKENFLDRLRMVAKTELGASLASAKFLFPLNYINGARGHDVSFVFLCRIQGKPKDGRWFKSMPKNMILEHKMLWRKIRQISINPV